RERATARRNARAVQTSRLRPGGRRNGRRAVDRRAPARLGLLAPRTPAAERMRTVILGVLAAAVLAAPAQARPPIAVHAQVSPAEVGVGDPFTYRVEVRIPSDGLDAGSVRLLAPTAPFEAVTAATTRRTHDGSALVLRREQRLVCVEGACAPGNLARA